MASQRVLAFPPGCTTRWPWPFRARCSGRVVAPGGVSQTHGAACVDRRLPERLNLGLDYWCSLPVHASQMAGDTAPRSPAAPAFCETL